MNQQYDADVSIVNNNAMHVQTLRSFGLINTQSTEQPLQLGLGWSSAQQWKPASPQSPPLSVSCKNIGTLGAILWWRRILLGFFVPGCDDV